MMHSRNLSRSSYTPYRRTGDDSVFMTSHRCHWVVIICSLTYEVPIPLDLLNARTCSANTDVT